MRIKKLIFLSLTILVFGGLTSFLPAATDDMSVCKAKPEQMAIPACTRVIEDRSKFPNERAEAYVWRATWHKSNGSRERAISDYGQALKIAPKDPIILHYVGEGLTGTGEYEPGLRALSESLRLRPNDAPTLDGRGRAYLFLREYDKAIADFSAALQLKPYFANSLYARGWAKLKIGDTAGGNADIAAAKRSLPDVAEKYNKYYGITITGQ